MTSIRNRVNALWFFVALLGGGAGVWWTKSAFADFPWVAAVVAAGVVLALTIYYVFNEEDAPEEEGDNVYYLGLLFTLVSLMLTLVNIFGLEAGGTPGREELRDLLANFGVALTSTVAGIAGRVVVLNWQRTGSAERPDFFEDAMVRVPAPARANAQDLEEFNRQLLGRIARDLTQGANALARFHRIVRSHASDTEEYLRSHSKLLRRESAAFKDTLQRNTETFARELKSQAGDTLETVGTSLSAAAQQAETLVEKLQSAHERYVADVGETTRSFHNDIRSASDRSLDTVRQNFEAVAKQSLSLGEKASAVHQEIGDVFDRFGSGVGHAGEASAALGDSARQAAQSTAVLESEVEKLRATFAAVHAGSETMASLFEAMGELDARIRGGQDTQQTAAAVQQIGETLRTIAAEGASATQQAAKAAELIDNLAQRVRTAESEALRAAEALRLLADEAEARTKTLRRRQGSVFGFLDRRE